MKKTSKVAVILLSALFIISGCGKSNRNAFNITDKNIRLTVDETHTIGFEGDKGRNIKWTSNDESIAIVGADGTVTAVGNGITTVTAEIADEYDHVGIIVGSDDEYVDSDGNEIQNFKGTSEITSIEVGVKHGGKKDISIHKGDTYELVAYTNPSDANDKIIWKSSDKKVVKVSESGNIEAVNTGKATIRAYAPNGVYGELLVRVK